MTSFRFREESPPRFKLSYALLLSLLLLLVLFLGVKEHNPFSLSQVELAQLAQQQAEQKRDMVFRFVDAPEDPVEVEDAKFLSDADRIAKSRQEDAPNQNQDPLSRGNTFEVKNRNNQPESESPQGQPSPPVVSPPSPERQVAEQTAQRKEAEQGEETAEQESADALKEKPDPVEKVAENDAPEPQEAGAGNAPLFEGGPKPYRKLSEAKKQELASKAAREMNSLNMSDTMGSSVDSGTYHNPDGSNAPNLGLTIETNRSDLGDYLKILRQLVKGNWRIPAIARFEVSGVSGVSFNIHKDGRITDVVLIKASGYEPLDVSAMNAITATYQAPPLPDHVDDDPLPMKFGFYYNMRPRY